MVDGYPQERLGGFASVQGGFAFKSADFKNSGVPVLKIKNVRIRDMDTSELDYVDEEVAKGATRYFCKTGDLLISMTGSGPQAPNSVVGRMARFTGISDKFLINQRVGRFIIKQPSKLDPRYLFFVLTLEEYQRYLVSTATGSANQANISGSQIENLEIPIPSFSEQRAIAAVLGSLDDKIESNRRMNETLEALAQTLFKSWFVDATQSALPKGWRMGVLDDLAETIIGGDWGSDQPTEEEIAPAFCIRGADIPDLQKFGIGKMPLRFLKRSSLEKRQLEDGDLAIEISGGSPTQSTGRPVLVSKSLLTRLEHPLICSNFCRILKLKSRNASKFVYLWLRWLYDNDELFQFETGTTGIKNFAFTIFSQKFELAIPPVEMLDEFNKVVSPLFEKQQSNGAESATLAGLRDALLPKLLSGELRVPAAAKLTEARA